MVILKEKAKAKFWNFGGFRESRDFGQLEGKTQVVKAEKSDCTYSLGPYIFNNKMTLAGLLPVWECLVGPQTEIPFL